MKIIFLIAAGAYAIVCIVAALLQARFVYFPDSESAGTPAERGWEFADVFFRVGSRTLHGWHVPVAGARWTILYCHGNAGNISHRLDSIGRFRDMGLGTFIFDYSGYGRSEGRPSEGALYADARAAWEWLTTEAGVSPDSVILFGRSLGTAVAVDLAADVAPPALVLESPFTSIVELGARVYWWLPVRFLSRQRFDSASKVGELRMPKLFVHSLEDDVIPYGMGKRLYNKAPRPKTWVRVRGDHNDVYLLPASRYATELREFLEALDRPRGEVRRM